LRRDHAARARTVLDNDGLAEIVLHLLRDDAGENVVAAARREADHEFDHVARIRRLRACGGRGRNREPDEQRGATERAPEMAGSHRIPPLWVIVRPQPTGEAQDSACGRSCSSAVRAPDECTG
jgi:hypothetical protein